MFPRPIDKIVRVANNTQIMAAEPARAGEQAVELLDTVVVELDIPMWRRLSCAATHTSSVYGDAWVGAPRVSPHGIRASRRPGSSEFTLLAVVKH